MNDDNYSREWEEQHFHYLLERTMNMYLARFEYIYKQPPLIRWVRIKWELFKINCIIAFIKVHSSIFGRRKANNEKTKEADNKDNI